MTRDETTGHGGRCRPRSLGASPGDTQVPADLFEQARDAALALLKGDPGRWGVCKEGLKTKAREILPGG